MARPDTSVCYFDSSMPGAPVLNGTAGSMLALLDACLVNGFGLKSVDSVVIASGVATITFSTGHSAFRDSVIELAGVTTPSSLNGRHKVQGYTTNTVTISVPDLSDQTATGTISMKLAAAGWLKAFSKPNVAAYKSADLTATGLYIRIDDTSATSCRVRGYETFTDIDTGTGLFPTDSQYSGGMWWRKSNNADSTSRYWCVIANSTMVYLGINNVNRSVKSFTWFGFGDIVSRKANDPYKFVVSGNPGDYTGGYTSTSPLFSTIGYQRAYRFMARGYSGLGGSSCACPLWLSRNLDMDVISGYCPELPFPNPADGSLLVSDVHLVETVTNKGYRGTVPGAYALIQSVQEYIPDHTIFDNITSLPGRRVAIKTIDTASNGYYGAVAFDLTGPWSK